MSFGRIVFGALLTTFGGLVAAFGVFVFLQNPQWQSGWFAFGSLLFGLLLIGEGWSVFQNARLRDVVDEIISALIWW